MAEVNQTQAQGRSGIVISYDDLVRLRTVIEELGTAAARTSVNGIIEELKSMGKPDQPDDDNDDRAKNLFESTHKMGLSAGYKNSAKMITRLLDGRPLITSEDDF